MGYRTTYPGGPDEPWDDTVCLNCGCDLPDEDPDPENTGVSPWWEGYCSEPCRRGEPVTFVRFTKRTNDPKLAWLESQLTEAGISHQRKGHSYHAPILEVESARIDDAWDILDPVDDIPDNDPMFTGGE